MSSTAHQQPTVVPQPVLLEFAAIRRQLDEERAAIRLRDRGLLQLSWAFFSLGLAMVALSAILAVRGEPLPWYVHFSGTVIHLTGFAALRMQKSGAKEAMEIARLTIYVANLEEMARLRLNHQSSLGQNQVAQALNADREKLGQLLVAPPIPEAFSIKASGKGAGQEGSLEIEASGNHK